MAEWIREPGWPPSTSTAFLPWLVVLVAEWLELLWPDPLDAWPPEPPELPLPPDEPPTPPPAEE